MTFWKKNKLKIIIPALIVLVLAAAFVFGDRNMPQPKAPAEQPTVALRQKHRSRTQRRQTRRITLRRSRQRHPLKRHQSRLTTRRQTNPRSLIPNSRNTFRRRKSRQAQPANMKKWAA